MDAGERRGGAMERVSSLEEREARGRKDIARSKCEEREKENWFVIFVACFSA